jgi:hypothetical protein
MPSGYSAGFEDRVLLDVGVLYYTKQGGDKNPTRFGVSVGGLSFEPEIEWRHIEFDGKRSDIEGLHRVTNRTGRIKGTFLIEWPTHIPLIEPGATQSPGGTWTPKAASTLLEPDSDYLQGVKLVATKPGTNKLVEVGFTRALVTKWSWKMTDKGEHQLADLEIVAVLDATRAAASTDTAPYTYKEISAIS